MNPPINKLYACTRLSRKIRLSGDKWNPYHYKLVHQQYIRKTSQVVFMLLKLKYLLLELDTLTLMSVFLQEKLENVLFIPKYDKYSVMPADMCTKLCSYSIISGRTKWMTGFIFYPTIDK